MSDHTTYTKGEVAGRTPLTPEEIEAIRARADAATPGPWYVVPIGKGTLWNIMQSHPRPEEPELVAELDACTYAVAHDIPFFRNVASRLCDDLLAARKRVEELEAERERNLGFAQQQGAHINALRFHADACEKRIKELEAEVARLSSPDLRVVYGYEAGQKAAEAEINRLREFAESIPGPGCDYDHSILCASCKRRGWCREQIDHDPNCLWLRAQQAMGKEPQP